MADVQQSKAKVTVHWLDKSRSQRIIWLLEECKDLDYEVKVYKRDATTSLAPPELKKVHPLGKSPVITVVEASALKEPLVVAESGAIFEYLCDHSANHLVPTRYQPGKENQIGGETEQWLRYRFYMHYAEGSLMSLLLIAMFMDQIRNAPVPFFIKPITRGIASKVDDAYLTENFKTQYGFLESQLASSPDGGKYLCGKDLTAADIMLSFPILAIKGRLDKATHPKLVEYAELLEQNDVYIRSVKKMEEITGEPFKLFPGA